MLFRAVGDKLLSGILYVLVNIVTFLFFSMQEVVH